MRAITPVRPKAVVRPDVTRRNTRRRVAVVTRASASSNENPSADAVATAKTWPTWGCEPSVFPWSYGAGEICLVIEGEATVVMDDGTVVLLKPGTIATFPKGSSCTWEVKAAIKKHYSFGP